MQTTEKQQTARQHAQRIAQMLQQAQQECRVNIEDVADPKAQALFETVAEVLGGTLKALEHYMNRSESAWQSQTQPQPESQEQQSSRPIKISEDPRLAPQGPQPPVVTDMAVDIDEEAPPAKLFTE